MVNLILGLIVSAYGWINVAVSTFVIAITVMILVLICSKFLLKDAYKVSLSIIISVLGFIEYLLTVLMPSRFTDNWYIIAIVVLMAFEAVLIVTANSVSTKTK